MSITPYHDLKSTDILSAHISGLQHSINKLESVLDMKTQSIAGHTLAAVNDQADSAYHYRIYEGSIRNWLETPVPRIYRNNMEVAGDEYTIQPSYGVVVFHEQQSPEDTITVDVNYVDSGSNFNDQLIGMTPFLQASGAWRTNSMNASNVIPKILIAANLMDAFPFPVSEETTYDAIAMKVDGTGASGTKARLGIFKDNGNCYPGELVADAGEVGTDTTGVKSLPISLTLQRGLYWIVRNSNGGPSVSGIANTDAINLGIDDSLSGAHAGAYRITSSYSALPKTFTSGADLLYRTAYASVWLRKG